MGARSELGGEANSERGQRMKEMVDTWKWLPPEVGLQNEITQGVIKEQIILSLAELGFHKDFPKTEKAFWALPEWEPPFGTLEVRVAASIAEPAEANPAPDAITGAEDHKFPFAEQLQWPPKVFLIPMRATILTRLQMEPEHGDAIFAATDKDGGYYCLVSLFGFVMREKWAGKETK